MSSNSNIFLLENYLKKYKRKNLIRDYEQVMEDCEKLVNDNNGRIIKEQKPIGHTTFGYPIKHFTVGNGKNHIVITGATHGCEIISTDFVLHLMEKTKEEDYLEFIEKNDLCLHFVPIVNPEGYIITTSAIREKIPKDMNRRDAEKICKEYYSNYRQDDINAKNNPDDKSLKEHQQMFEHVTPDCIGDQHSELRKYVWTLINQGHIPKGSLVSWAANGRGVDINANAHTNPKIPAFDNNEVVYGNFRYNNIITSKPGPIGCPTDTKGFSYQPETIAIATLLKDISQKGNLLGSFIYHGTGGMIYNVPCNLYGNTIIKCNEEYNDKLAKIYHGPTEYKIKGEQLPYSSNELLRILYPGNILVELSRMGGNPIGPYGDINGNYIRTINENLIALEKTIEKMPQLKKERDNSIKQELKKQKSNLISERVEKFNSLKGSYEVACTVVDYLKTKEICGLGK